MKLLQICTQQQPIALLRLQDVDHAVKRLLHYLHVYMLEEKQREPGYPQLNTRICAQAIISSTKTQTVTHTFWTFHASVWQSENTALMMSQQRGTRSVGERPVCTSPCTHRHKQMCFFPLSMINPDGGLTAGFSPAPTVVLEVRKVAVIAAIFLFHTSGFEAPQIKGHRGLRKELRTMLKTPA